MNENLPPPNRAIGWYRFLLWLMPSCFLTLTAFLTLKFDMGLGVHGEVYFWLMIALNVLAALAVGVFDSRIGRARGRKLTGAVVRFMVLQAMVAPVVATIVIYGLCSARIL